VGSLRNTAVSWRTSPELERLALDQLQGHALVDRARAWVPGVDWDEVTKACREARKPFETEEEREYSADEMEDPTKTPTKNGGVWSDAESVSSSSKTPEPMADYDDQCEADSDDPLNVKSEGPFRRTIDLDEDDKLARGDSAEQERKRAFEEAAERERLLQSEWHRTNEEDERKTKARITEQTDSAKTMDKEDANDCGGGFPAASSRDKPDKSDRNV